MGMKVGCIGFSCQNVAAMPFVSQDLHDRVCRPADIPEVRFATESDKSIGDLLSRIAVKIHIKA